MENIFKKPISQGRNSYSPAVAEAVYGSMKTRVVFDAGDVERAALGAGVARDDTMRFADKILQKLRRAGLISFDRDARHWVHVRPA